jgi:DUF1365 family protein
MRKRYLLRVIHERDHSQESHKNRKREYSDTTAIRGVALYWKCEN